MKKYVFAFLSFIMILFLSCEFFPFILCVFDKIKISKIENTTNKLKLNGYYYELTKPDSTSFVYLLYGDGVFNNQWS
jgi:hypothetical protein